MSGQPLIGFDAAQDCTRIVPLAKAAGVAWIGRYLSFNPRKNLTAPEAAAIFGAGLDIVSIWEAQGDLFRTFTEANGLREGAAALAQAQALGQPPMTAIFFAVDFDANETHIIAGIVPYFRAVNEVLAGHYKVGVYGSGLVCSRLDAAGLVAFDFLAGAMGWQGSRAYAKAHIAEIEQQVDVDPWGFGFNIDRDTAPAGSDFGSWHPPAPVPVPVPVPVPNVIEQILAYASFRAGVEMYQRSRGLTPDGRIGPNTLRAIGADMTRQTEGRP